MFSKVLLACVSVCVCDVQRSFYHCALKSMAMACTHFAIVSIRFYAEHLYCSFSNVANAAFLLRPLSGVLSTVVRLKFMACFAELLLWIVIRDNMAMPI